MREITRRMQELKKFLDRKHMMDLLLELYERPGQTQAELIEGDGRMTRFKRLGELQQAGFIEPRVSTAARRNAIVYYLTEEGEKHARRFFNAYAGKDEEPSRSDHGAPSEQRGSVKN
jgi:DNA-binding MarR family transcriptional regulator